MDVMAIDLSRELGTNFNSSSINELNTNKNVFLYLNFENKITGSITLVILQLNNFYIQLLLTY